MKKNGSPYEKTVAIWILLFFSSAVYAQNRDSVNMSAWHHTAEANFYFRKSDFIFNPVYMVDKNWLHLEARYNYEGKNTFSAWFGYNFTGGKKFQYTITPCLGGIVGETYGVAPGLEMDFLFYGLQLSSQSEYVFDFKGPDNYYFYNWTDLTYSPLQWLWFGLSMQRTRLFKSNLDFQYGFIAGGGYKWFGLSAYLYNPGLDDAFIVLALSFRFPSP